MLAQKTQVREEAGLRANQLYLGMQGEINDLFRAATTSFHSSFYLTQEGSRAALTRSEQVLPAVRHSLRSTAFPWRIPEPLRKHDQIMLSNDLCLYTYGGWVYSYKNLMSINQTRLWRNIKYTTDCSNSETKLFSSLKLTEVPLQQSG